MLEMWDSPWGLYFRGLIWLPVLIRLVLLLGPAIKGYQIHGPHLRWLLERFRHIPRANRIAISFLIGLFLPIIIGLSRFIIEPTLEDFAPMKWDETATWQVMLYTIFFVVHTTFDFRRIYRTRQLAVRILRYDIRRYRPVLDRAFRFGDWLSGTAAKGREAEKKQRVRRTTGFLAGGIVGGFNRATEWAMKRPVAYAERWMMTNVAKGIIFHLSPLLMLILFFHVL